MNYGFRLTFKKAFMGKKEREGPKNLLGSWIIVIYTYILNFIPIHQTVSELEGFKEKRIVN